MASLLLTFTDPSGKNISVAVDKERFSIGRHSDCDLTISDSRLSREHLLIEKIGESFVATERGSSNGTDLNGEAIYDPRQINDGDVLSLGGFEIKVEVVNDDADKPTVPPPSADPVAAQSSAPAVHSHPAASDGISTKFLVVAAVSGFAILGVLAIVIFFSIGGRTSGNSNFVYSGDPDDTPKPRKTPEPGATTNPTNDLPSNGTVSPTPGNTASVQTPATVPDGGKTEMNAAAFLRKIAQNDPHAFVTGEHAKIIDGKIKSVSGSSALVDNLASARKNGAAIKSLAVSKNLKPQFLAVAAITSLGGSRGDVLQSAQNMADTLDKFSTQIGNELGEDCLLMMAGYGQGDPLKMRNMLQSLATTATESSRTIRTIWYLKKAGKITDNEYDFALRFLAIGAIAQNPRDFGVNAEGLNF